MGSAGGQPPLPRVVTLCELPELSTSFSALCQLYFELINNLKSCDCYSPGRGDAALDGVGRHAETAPRQQRWQLADAVQVCVKAHEGPHSQVDTGALAGMERAVLVQTCEG